MQFALVDLSNLFHRARYGAVGDADTRAALALHIIFRGLRKLWREYRIEHFVFAVDDGSWRYLVYPGYKARRHIEQTPREQHEQQQAFQTLNNLEDYLAAHTRCTVLREPGVEGDDFIARWITRHPNDQHLIVSSDSDFVQLIASNVRIFDAIHQRLISHDVIRDDHGRKVAFGVSPKDGKIRIGEPDEQFTPEADWWRKALFVKLVRGDVGDSIFSAFPGVRYEGKQCSIRAAWEDRTDQGYDWNNLMCQTWEKLTETGASRRVRVIDEFRINEHLIDLTKQPVHIVQAMDAAMDRVISRPRVKQVGAHFLRFCDAHDLPALAKEANDHVAYLNIGYTPHK
jgi:5'-3' exonuclease, N-terminal resolvase-like domain